MQIPVEFLFSPLRGGWFEWDAKSRRGEWWKGGKLIARWRRTKDGRALVEWLEEAKVKADV